MVFPGKKVGLIVFIVVLTGIVLFSRNQVFKSDFYQKTEYFMDTSVTVKVKKEPGAEEAVSRSMEVMKQWSLKLDRFNSESIINKINNSAGERVLLTENIYNLLKMAGKYYNLSSGAFDISVAPLMDLWGFGREEKHVPAEQEINSVRERVGLSKLEFNTADMSVILPAGMSLDLGGMAKGFIIDRGMESLQGSGINSAYINAGGNIRVSGKKPDNSLWQIGVRKPRGQAEVYQDFILALAGGSVATSGDYERYFIQDGIRYSHLIDPRTGYQAREMQTVTVYAPTAVEADILSTSLFIMGWQAGQELVENLTGVEAMMAREDERWVSSGFHKIAVFR